MLNLMVAKDGTEPPTQGFSVRRPDTHSTVTDFARFLGLSTSVLRTTAV